MTFNDLQLMCYTQLCKLSNFEFLFCLIAVVYVCYVGDIVPFKTFRVFCFGGSSTSGLCVYRSVIAYVIKEHV